MDGLGNLHRVYKNSPAQPPKLAYVRLGTDGKWSAPVDLTGPLAAGVASSYGIGTDRLGGVHVLYTVGNDVIDVFSEVAGKLEANHLSGSLELGSILGADRRFL